MKKLTLLLLSLFFFSSPSVFADDIDLYELSIQYPQCQNSTYRDECFDDYSFGTDVINRDVGYFRDNLIWEGLIWQNDVLMFETYEGVRKAVSDCPKGLDGWHQCPDGQKFKPLEDGYTDANGKQGRFIFHFAGGDFFEGNYENNLKNGYGKMTWSDGDVYEGNWKNGTQNGYGKYTWPSGNVYEGNWKNDYKYSYGKFTWSDGDVYEGNWENNVINGYGKKTWLEGDVYEGNWENGNQNGYGKYTWPDGDVYEGNWENGNMSD